MDDNMIQCPKCGHDNDSSSEECDNCGVTLSLVLGDIQKNKPQPEPEVSQIPYPENLQECPKCGHAVADSAPECIKCGIIFSKYFKVQDRILRETLDGLERSALEETPEAEPQKEDDAEQEKTEAERLEAEVRDKEKARLEAERLKAKQEEAAKAEAKKKEMTEKEQAEKKKAETPTEKPAEKETVEASNKADLQRIAKLEKEAETLRLQAAALKNEKQEYEKAAIVRKEQQEKESQEVIQKAQEAQARITTLQEETQALKNETETLKKGKVDLEAADALRKEQDQQEAEKRLQAEKEEQEKTEALEKERQDTQKRTATILKSVLPKPTMKELLKKYEGETIGINFDDPAEIKSATLAKVNEDHFSIMVPENELVHSYPYSDIVSIVEGVEGVPIDVSGETPTFPVVIRVFHLMVKKKWGFI